MRFVVSSAAVLLALACGTHAARAQLVQGQVVDSVSGVPVGAGFVVLVGPDGEEIVRTLTARDGRFTIRLGPDQPGPVHLRSERIGYRVATTEPFRPSVDGTVELVIRIHALPTRLVDIGVEETSECRLNPAEDDRTALVWDEAQKALAAASWTASQDLYHMVSDVYRRDLDRRGRLTEPERHRPHRGSMTSPFVSRDPQQLLATGYVVHRDGSFDYYAPDAEVLQGPGFLETHCFRLARAGDDRELIGIAFEPAPSRELPDVEGVLWLDRQSYELRSLEYEYANLPPAVRTSSEGGGGTIDFMPLASGAWIVRRWQIRIPTAIRSEPVDQFDRFPRRIADAFREDGGEVLTVTDPAGTRLYQAPLADLVAMVVDSSKGVETRVAGAAVRIDGTWFEGTTDERGMARIGAPLDGEYGVTFSVDAMETLGYTLAPVPVTLARGQTDTLWLQMPSTTDMMEGVCEESIPSDAVRVLVGTVREAASGRPVPDARVVASWQHIDENAAMRFAYEDKYATSTTDDAGFYAICGMEVARPTLVYAQAADSRSELLRVAFERDGVEIGNDFHATQRPFWRLDLNLQSASSTATLVSGIVTDAVSGRALPGAVVTISDATTSVVTDSAGVFQLEGLQAGSYSVTITRPGYAGRSGTLEIADDRPNVLSAGFSALTPVAQLVGTVQASETGRPVPEVRVTLVSVEGDSVAMTGTDESGRFVLTAPRPGSYYVASAGEGHAPNVRGPYELRLREAVDVLVSLDSLAVELDPLTVTGQALIPSLVAAGFYRRQAEGRGVFLDRQVIDQRAASQLGDLLRAIPGVTVDYNGLIRLRGVGRMGGPCGAPLVYVDGIAVNRDEAAGGVANASQWQRSVHPTDIEAIEVYRSPSEIPAEYNVAGNAACGVILIWRRQ